MLATHRPLHAQRTYPIQTTFTHPPLPRTPQVSTRLDALDLFNVKREAKREAMRLQMEEAKQELEEQERLQAEMTADIENAQRTTWGRTYDGEEIAALTGKELTQYKRRLKR